MIFFFGVASSRPFFARGRLSESINFVSGVAKVNSGCVCMAGLFFMAQQKENFFLFFFTTKQFRRLTQSVPTLRRKQKVNRKISF